MFGHLCVLASLLAIVFGQQCGKSKFDGFNKCLNNSINECINTVNQAAGNRTIKNECRRCFEESHCTAPDFDHDSNENHPEIDQMFPKANHSKVMQCIIEVAVSVQNDVDVCVNDAYPGFSSLSVRNIAGLIGQNGKSLMMKVMNALGNCKRNSEVMVCMMYAVRKSGMQNPMQKFCNSTKGCIKTLNESCNVVKVRAAVCDCANKLLSFGDNGNANKYVDQFYSCIKQAPPNRRTYPSKFGGYAKMLVSKICTADFCQDQQNHGQDENAHENGGGKGDHHSSGPQHGGTSQSKEKTGNSRSNEHH